MQVTTPKVTAPSVLALSPILVSSVEAAKLLGITQRLLRELTASGQLPHVRLGERVIRYRPADLDAWAADRSQPGAA